MIASKVKNPESSKTRLKSSSATMKTAKSTNSTINSTENVKSNKIDYEDEEKSVEPEFIYGGPFIQQAKPGPFMDTTTPTNLQLQGTFKKSFAYYSMKERIPVILTKVIDYLARETSKIKSGGASDEDIRNALQYITKLKNDVATNKKFELLQSDTPEAKKWNKYISEVEPPYYYTSIWVFSECYIYRRLREPFELSKTMQKFDPFAPQKEESFTNTIEQMCVVADRLTQMVNETDKDKRKQNFITLLKLGLWANMQDLSLSLGTVANFASDPLKMITERKDKLLADDSSKAADGVCKKADKVAANIEKPAKEVDKADGPQPEPEKLPEIPCPSKMTVPTTTMFDIVCDNAGYELFTDLCLGHFLINLNIVKRVRFHVKQIPWFVSDVTPADFQYVINGCTRATFDKELPPPPLPKGAVPEVLEEGAVRPPPPRLTAASLNVLGSMWSQYYADGTFMVMADDYWTSPNLYKDMKTVDPHLYRKLQFAVAILFKGDLNYRKLLGEKKWVPSTGFEHALQGFQPAPIIAARTVKAELICGISAAALKKANDFDPKWMEKGEFGVIHFCAKSEALKASDKPCVDYGNECKGVICPQHPEL